MDILYLCNGKKCAGVDCEGKRLNSMSHIQPYSECCHTLNVNYAKNGLIKGPIDLIKRFRIRLRPHVYLEEKNGKKNSR